MQSELFEVKNLENPEKTTLIEQLENGSILFLPQPIFSLTTDEEALLTPSCIGKRTKNISYLPETTQLRGSLHHSLQQKTLQKMMARYASITSKLIRFLLPAYDETLIIGRTSFRPRSIKSKKPRDYKKDDTRLHVDAFSATPVHEKRILRFFTNINPDTLPRVWQIGQPFRTVAETFLPCTSNYNPHIAKWLSRTKITKSVRSVYDHYMLQLHDLMKADMHYQSSVKKQRIAFPAGTSWIVFTDQVSHAAISGQYVLEQTFYLPVDAMCNPALAPRSILSHLLQTVQPCTSQP